MNRLELNIEEGRLSFSPGEAVNVELEWELEERTTEIKLRLVWFTKTKGKPEFELIQEESISNPDLTGKRSFKFQIPIMPYSFQGKLFSLIWAFEAELIPGKRIFRQEISIGPDQKAVSVSESHDA